MKTEIILGFSFGGRGREPGLSNEAIARDIKEFLHKGVLLIVQWEVGIALRRLGVFPDLEIGRFSGPYLTTIDVAKEMIGKIKEAGISVDETQITVFAHHSRPFSRFLSHQKRCVRILHRLGAKVLISSPIRIPYDRKSHQWWTRNAFLWHVRSALAIPIVYFQEFMINPL